MLFDDLDKELFITQVRSGVLDAMDKSADRFEIPRLKDRHLPILFKTIDAIAIELMEHKEQDQ